MARFKRRTTTYYGTSDLYGDSIGVEKIQDVVRERPVVAVHFDFVDTGDSLSMHLDRKGARRLRRAIRRAMRGVA